MNFEKQLRRLYGYSFAACLRITSAVWVALLAARGFSLWQIGLAEGIFHITSLVFEIPSGVAADLLGRRRTLALSGILGAASSLAMAIAGSHYALVCFSMALSALGISFISGTQEAITYDSLKAVGREEDYLQVDATATQLQTLADIVSDLASLLAGVMSYVGFYLLDAAITLSRTVLALTLAEPVVTAAQAARTRHPFAALPARLRSHIRTAAAFLRANPRVCLLIAANALISLPCYLTIMFFQQRLTELSLPIALLGLPLLAIEGVRMLGTAVGRRLPHGALLPLFVGCALLCGLGTLAAGVAPLWGAIAGAMLYAAAFNVWMLHAQKDLNDAYPSDQRATLVSVDSMAYSVCMILASPLTGQIGDFFGTAGAGLAALGLMLCAVALAAALRLATRPH